MGRLCQLFYVAAFAGVASMGSGEEEAKGKGRVEPPCVGIDLGTTYSVVGVWQKGEVQIIPNEMGNRITPSYVSWDGGGERLIGDAAKNQATVNPEQTVFDVKRLIGRKYTDKTVQADKKVGGRGDTNQRLGLGVGGRVSK